MGKQYLNGVLYGTGEIIKFSPYIYSLEEREVGVWTDGKPLYARTWISSFAYDSQSRSYSADVANLDFSNFDKVVYSSVQMVNSTVSTTIPYYSVGNDQVYYWYSKTDNKIYIRANTDRMSYNAHTTLYYTKTTDTPGSGHYTTKGGEAHHYSTSEQIVGTWIDGKPLYEKTYHYIGTLNSSSWVTLDSSRLPSNTPYFSVTNVCFISTEISSSAKMSAYTTRIPFDIVISNGEQLYFENKSNYKIYEFIVTVQYTKTTD